MNAQEAATLYITKGWYPIPLNPGTKECRDAKWRDHIYTPEEFKPTENVGIRLVGSKDTRSTKLVGVDLDAEEAVNIAHHFLPPSTAAWGRKTKRISQILYTSPFEKPISYKDFSNGKTTIIEIRVDHQSMAPPSVHPNGEQLAWLHEDYEAPKVEAAVLQRAVQLIATTTLIIRYYNPKGNRHDWGVALAGALRLLKLTEDEASKVFSIAAAIAGDTKNRDRLTEVKTTYSRPEDSPLAGFGQLSEQIGTNGDSFIESLKTIWGVQADFKMNAKGGISSNDQENVKRALSKLGVVLSFNRFSYKMYATVGKETRILEDDILDRIWLEIDKRFGFRPSRDFFDTVVRDTARRLTFHPVIDYFEGLKWDGTPRIDRWLIDYGGSENNEYTRAVGAMVLIAAVRRVRDPGCKFDEILVLESRQGYGKSSALRALCPNPEWFSDDMPLNVDSKQVIERTSGKWIVEAAELSGLRKSQIEQLKALLSRQVDGPVRMAYARLSVEVPRQFIVVGTTNANAYLKDPTGNRRFWPVKVKKFDIKRILEDRDQLWAEAAKREADGEDIRLAVRLYGEAGKEQERRLTEDPWEEHIRTQFSEEETVRALPDKIWDILGIPLSNRDERAQERINTIMQKLGFRKIAMRNQNQKVVKGWARDVEPSFWEGEDNEAH